jgi:hypothetical protein
MEECPVVVSGAKNDTQHFIDLTEYLFKEGYLTDNDISYTPGHGKIRYLES